MYYLHIAIYFKKIIFFRIKSGLDGFRYELMYDIMQCRGMLSENKESMVELTLLQMNDSNEYQSPAWMKELV